MRLIEDEQFPTSCSDPYGLLRNKTILGEEMMASLAVTAFGTRIQARVIIEPVVLLASLGRIFSAAGNTIMKKRNPLESGHFLCSCFLSTIMELFGAAQGSRDRRASYSG